MAPGTKRSGARLTSIEAATPFASAWTCAASAHVYTCGHALVWHCRSYHAHVRVCWRVRAVVRLIACVAELTRLRSSLCVDIDQVRRPATGRSAARVREQPPPAGCHQAGRGSRGARHRRGQVPQAARSPAAYRLWSRAKRQLMSHGIHSASCNSRRCRDRVKLCCWAERYASRYRCRLLTSQTTT